MKTLHNIFVPILVTFLLVCSCTKDDKISSEKASFNILKGKVDAAPLTKTLYEYSEKTLKVSWNTGDLIAVSDGSNLYKFTQTGEITDNGHTALFSGDNPTAIGEGDIVAVYPYTENLEYNLTSQEGVINKLFLTDILLAKAHVSPTVVEDLVFNPLCVVMRIPKDILITDEDFSGVMKVSLSGENVGGKLTISKTGGIDIQVDKITFPITISSGKITEDAYMTFVPKSKMGTFSYTIESERGDFYTFNVENITPTKLYAVKNIFDGNVIFEDANFKKYCVDNFDINGDGEISFNEAKKVTAMYFSSLTISSLKGVEYFKNLKILMCNGGGVTNLGSLTVLDLSKSIYLEKLYCNYNQLTNINLSNCRSLTHIYCQGNKISSLDLSSCKDLTLLYCGGNQLASLNLSNNTKLEILSCGPNQLTSLDLSNNTKLEGLSCERNLLTSLDLSNNANLLGLNCFENQLTSLDLSKNSSLQSLHCETNKLTSLDLSNKTKLKEFDCIENELSSLDLSNTLISSLRCFRNKLVSLIVNPQLGSLECWDNQLTSLDLSNNTNITVLHCGHNKLTSLNLSNNTKLERIDCEDNQLTELDLSKNTSLTSLYCNKNQISSLDLSNNTALITLTSFDNQLTSLDVSKNASLKEISAWYFNTDTGIPIGTNPTTLKVKKGGSYTMYMWGTDGYGVYKYYAWLPGWSKWSWLESRFGVNVIEID